MKISKLNSSRFKWLIIAGIVSAVGAVVYVYANNQITPTATAQASLYDIVVDKREPRALTWPNYGQSAVATKDYGVLAVHGYNEPQPTASTAKLITMLAVMREKPFSDGKGAVITFSDRDAQSYRDYAAGNGTVTRVEAGWQWTQYQALQAILLQSANNVSDSLAIWAFGSLDNYREYAQEMVLDLGMQDTVIGVDASGYSPTTISTAGDLAKLASHVLDEPVLREIAGQESATLPGVGAILNTSWVTDDEVIGIKNGWLPEAGGVFVLAGQQELDGHRQEIIAVVMGASGGPVMARGDAHRLYRSAKDNFYYQTVIKKGQQVGQYYFDQPNFTKSVLVKDSAGLFMWGDMMPDVSLKAKAVSLKDSGVVGEASIRYGEWETAVNLLTE